MFHFVKKTIRGLTNFGEFCIIGNVRKFENWKFNVCPLVWLNSMFSILHAFVNLCSGWENREKKYAFNFAWIFKSKLLRVFTILVNFFLNSRVKKHGIFPSSSTFCSSLYFVAIRNHSAVDFSLLNGLVQKSNAFCQRSFFFCFIRFFFSSFESCLRNLRFIP